MFIPCGMIGLNEWIIIILVILLLFGGRKIPELMRGLGRGVKEFKDAVNTNYSDEERTPAPKNARKHETAEKESEK